jgi:hypothetical protein
MADRANLTAVFPAILECQVNASFENSLKSLGNLDAIALVSIHRSGCSCNSYTTTTKAFSLRARSACMYIWVVFEHGLLLTRRPRREEKMGNLGLIGVQGYAADKDESIGFEVAVAFGITMHILIEVLRRLGGVGPKVVELDLFVIGDC